MSLPDNIDEILHMDQVKHLLQQATEHLDTTSIAVYVTIDTDGRLHVVSTSVRASELVGILDMAKHWVLTEWWEQETQDEEKGD